MSDETVKQDVTDRSDRAARKPWNPPMVIDASAAAQTAKISAQSGFTELHFHTSGDYAS